MPQPKIVLLVEDDKLLVSTLLKIFEHEKFKVVVETNGLKALSAVKKNRPNLILLDLLLPGMHGFDIMKKLKADENYKNIPIIIIINLSEKNDKVIVSIQDFGYGIPDYQQKRVFEKFFRADNIANVATEGTGLGLYIAKAIIEAHGGHLYFTSKENQGSTFGFELNKK